MQKFAFSLTAVGSAVDFVVDVLEMNELVVVRWSRNNRRDETVRDNNRAARAIKRAFAEAGVEPVRATDSGAEKKFFFATTTLSIENKRRVAVEIVRAAGGYIAALADIFACIARTNDVPVGFVEPVDSLVVE